MKTRTLLCFPTYNNPRTVAEVVTGALAALPFDALVVDDGSTTAVESHFQGSEHREDPRLHHLRFETNRGKGAALQAAFRWAVARGYTHLLTVDADGQHPVTELAKLVEESERHPWALIIGHRNMDKAEVPDVSKFGRRFSNFWVHYQTDHPVLDSQSGLRLYPLAQVQTFRFLTRRYDFEIEVLIRLIWAQVEVREVPVEVIYQAPGERTSHFDKLWDNARISALNAVLVVLSLLRERTSPMRLAAALGAGVWIGCLPFYGFHTLLAAGAAFFFRLNFVALLAGTQISFPPLLAALIPATLAIGQRAGATSEAGKLALGWFLLGSFLGPATFALAWPLLALKKNPRRRKAWAGEQRGGRLGNEFLKLVLRTLGLRAAYFCMFFVVPYFYAFVPKARKAADQYWRLIRPDMAWPARRRATLWQMYRFSTVLLDSIYLSIKGRKSFHLEGGTQAALRSAIDRGRGVMLLSAHIGAWEVAARCLRRHEFLERLHVVRYEGQGLTFTKVQAPAREYTGIATNRQELPVLAIREALQRGDLVSMMADRPHAASRALIPLFGHLAAVDLAPFRLAITCGASVIVGFGIREGYKKYSFRVEELSPPNPSLTKNDQALQMARAYFVAVENTLRSSPAQWFNWFPFWGPWIEDSGSEAKES